MKSKNKMEGKVRESKPVNGKSLNVQERDQQGVRNRLKTCQKEKMKREEKRKMKKYIG